MTKLFRFISLPKYIDLITSQSLYFSRADRMNDPGEGGWLLHGMMIHDRRAAVMALREKLEIKALKSRFLESDMNQSDFLALELCNPLNSKETKETIEYLAPHAILNKKFDLLKFLESIYHGRSKIIDDFLEKPNKYKREFEKSKRNNFLSCWHKKSAANQAMWAAYGSSSTTVAIQTDSTSLAQAVSSFRFQRHDSKWMKSCGDVRYLNEEVRDDPSLVSNILIDYVDDPTAVFKIKSDAYEFENEHRAIIQWTGKKGREEHGIRIPFKRNLIETVFINPRSSEKNLIKQAVVSYHSAFSGTFPEVTVSDIDPLVV